jgi:hypothetical protein
MRGVEVNHPAVSPKAEEAAMDVLEGDTTARRLYDALVAFCETEELTVECQKRPSDDPSVSGIFEMQRLVGPWRMSDE